VIAEALSSHGAKVTQTVVPDGEESVADAIRTALDGGARLIITTGGTGIGPRDRTPEGTAPFISRPLPGVPELLRNLDAALTPTVALSRGLAGVSAGDSPAFIVNLPGSEPAVQSAMTVLHRLCVHALAQLDGTDH